MSGKQNLPNDLLHEIAVSKKSVPYEVSPSLWLTEFSHTIAGKPILQHLPTGLMSMINKPTFLKKVAVDGGSRFLRDLCTYFSG